MRRPANPPLSSSGESALAHYREALWEYEDLANASRRNYLSDLRHFAAWYEAHSLGRAGEATPPPSEFSPQTITTPALTRYRSYFQKQLHQKPNSVNRALISVKRYCSWAMQKQLISYDPSAPVKLVGEEEHAPRHLGDEEEQALVAAVSKEGTLRDRVLIVLLLHTGLRAREVCQLRRDQVKLGKRSWTLEVIGKRNKYREVPLNGTAHKILTEYLPVLPSETTFLFPSSKTRGALSERALGYIVAKYAAVARLADVSPHDLRHRFGYWMAEAVPLHRLAQIMGHDSLDTTKLYILNCTFKERNRIYKRQWRRSRGRRSKRRREQKRRSLRFLWLTKMKLRTQEKMCNEYSIKRLGRNRGWRSYSLYSCCCHYRCIGRESSFFFRDL